MSNPDFEAALRPFPWVVPNDRPWPLMPGGSFCIAWEIKGRIWIQGLGGLTPGIHIQRFTVDGVVEIFPFPCIVIKPGKTRPFVAAQR